MSDGSTRTDRNTYTPEEIADAGYVQAGNAPYVTYPNKLDWDVTDWIVREPNETEIENKWAEIKTECQQILLETDYKVIKAYELNIILDQIWIDYRQSIRDIYNNVNDLDPWNILWPDRPND